MKTMKTNENKGRGSGGCIGAREENYFLGYRKSDMSFYRIDYASTEIVDPWPNGGMEGSGNG